MSKEKKIEEGWQHPLASKKWHYFREGRSLCRKWMFLGEHFEQGNDESEDNCTSCKKILKKELGNPPTVTSALGVHR